jgi:hypothetical protein
MIKVEIIGKWTFVDWTWLERIAKDEHSSLFVRNVNDGDKMFLNAD